MASEFYLYILHSCNCEKYYIGYSTDPWRRITEHNSDSRNTFTAKYRPWEIKAVFQIGKDQGKALMIERFIKNQKTIALIEKLLDPNFQPTGYLAHLVRVPHVRD